MVLPLTSPFPGGREGDNTRENIVRLCRTDLRERKELRFTGLHESRVGVKNMDLISL